MSKKQDAIYFDNFIECAGYASKAALMLKDIFRNFDPAKMPEWMDQIHSIEHAADKCRHGMTDKLAKACFQALRNQRKQGETWVAHDHRIAPEEPKG